VPDIQQTIDGRNLQSCRGVVKELARLNAALASQEPFKAVADDRVPGESIAVDGMLHRLLTRLPDSTPPIDLQQLMLANNPRLIAGQPQNLTGLLASMGDGKELQSFFERQRGKALALTFRNSNPADNRPDILAEQPAEIRLVESANRDS